jgi:riboflavin kinase/FMN adenylyltransferase
MKLIRDIEHYQPSGPLCLALGNFDGVHLGHQQLIKECVDFAAINKGTAAAYIFDPHPSGRLPPSGLGISTLRTGWGSYVPVLSS